MNFCLPVGPCSPGTPFIPTHLAAPRTLNYYFLIGKTKPVKPVKRAKNKKAYGTMERYRGHKIDMDVT